MLPSPLRHLAVQGHRVYCGPVNQSTGNKNLWIFSLTYSAFARRLESARPIKTPTTAFAFVYSGPRGASICATRNRKSQTTIIRKTAALPCFSAIHRHILYGRSQLRSSAQSATSHNASQHGAPVILCPSASFSSPRPQNRSSEASIHCDMLPVA